jgi:hypothetical protein
MPLFPLRCVPFKGFEWNTTEGKEGHCRLFPEVTGGVKGDFLSRNISSRFSSRFSPVRFPLSRSFYGYISDSKMAPQLEHGREENERERIERRIERKIQRKKEL